MDRIRQYFDDKLRSTGRAGIDKVISELETLGYFEAPASTAFHLSEPGGLLRHSVNVCVEALALRDLQLRFKPELADKLPLESVIIVALLHDVCKAEVYVEQYKNRKREDGVWERYLGYGVDYSNLPLGHGEKSVIRLLRWGLELTDEEMLAIRWHMSAWDMPFQSPELKSNLNAAQDKTPLVGLLIAADGLASSILER